MPPCQQAQVLKGWIVEVVSRLCSRANDVVKVKVKGTDGAVCLSLDNGTMVLGVHVLSCSDDLTKNERAVA